MFEVISGLSPIADLRAGRIAEAGRPHLFGDIRRIDAEIAALQAQRMQALGRLGEEALVQAELDAELHPEYELDRRRQLQWRSAAMELAAATNTGTDAGERQLAEAWTLTEKCQITLHALASGEISLGHARTIARELGDLGLFEAARAQEALLPYARRLSPALFTRKARELLDRNDPQKLADRHARAYAERHVEVDGARDGMAMLSAYLDAADAAVIGNGLRNAAGEARQLGDVRTRRQLEADLFVELLMEGRVTVGRPVGGDADSGELGSAPLANKALADKAPVTIELLVPAATAAGSDEAPGKIAGVGMIDPGRARELIARAPSLRRILTDPFTSAIVDFDRTTYRVPAELKRMILRRDEHCRAPNCGRPVAELDHTVGFAGAGITSRWNLAGFCSNHHHLKHESGWGLVQYAEGVLDWISPTGRHYLTVPDVVLPAPPPPPCPSDYADDVPF